MVMVQLDWHEAEAVPARPANVVLVQGFGTELFLTFGHAPPPAPTAFLNQEQLTEYLKNNPVVVRQISRLTLPIDAARTLMAGLEDALRNTPTGTGTTVTEPEVSS